MPVRSLSKELQAKAEIEVNEVPSRVLEDIQHIRDWISKQPHLEIKPDDQWILNFLRGSKFSLQQTKNKLDVYYTIRTVAPEFFGVRDPFHPEIQDFLKRGIFTVLPETSNSLEPRRILLRLKDSDPQVFNITKIIKCCVMIIDVLTLEDDGCAINGQEIVVDLQAIPYSYVGQATPHILKSIVILLENAYAARIKGMHFINIPTFFHAVLSLFKSFFPEKMKNRIHFYPEANIDKFYDIIPVAALPEEYGGKAGSIEKLSNDQRIKIESYSSWFEEDSQNRSNETKRRAISKLPYDFCSMEDGSFRILNID